MSEMNDKRDIKLICIVAAVGIVAIVLMFVAGNSPFKSISKNEGADLVGGATKKAECNDKIDNDKDGKIDYPNDKGCSSKSDTTENSESQTKTICGNKLCESGESSSNCGKDCSPICGNSLCEAGETSNNCASDCKNSQTSPPQTSSVGIARVEIRHTFIGDLVVYIYVGEPRSLCRISISNRQGGTTDDIRRDIDLSPCASYLPPSSSNPWFLYVEDKAAVDEGQIEVFRITTGGQTYTANGLPMPILDFTSTLVSINSYCGNGLCESEETSLNCNTDCSDLILHSSILPNSRSVQVGQTATAFATILASGTGTARGCRIAPISSIPASFSFQTTDPTTNQVTGTPNTPVDILGGSGQSFVISLTPTAPLAAEVIFSFDCDNTEPAPILAGVNTLQFAASSTPVPDIIALAATPSNDGILNIPENGAAAFSIATSNVGATAFITASADTGSVILPLVLSICETNPANAQCKSPPGTSVGTQIDAGSTPTFSVFGVANGAIPFDPANNRIFVRFKDASGTTRGSTSVAVRTQ